MKKLFLALLAMVAFVACDNTDYDYDYEFEIADGVFVSGVVEPITYEQFCEEMVGSAWAADLSSARLILEDGSIDNKPHYELTVGGAYTHFYFDKNSIVVYIDKAIIKGYVVSDYQYDEGVIISDMYTEPILSILELEKDKMVCIQHVGWTPNIGSRFIICTYNRLDDDEYEKIKHEYTHEL